MKAISRDIDASRVADELPSSQLNLIGAYAGFLAFAYLLLAFAPNLLLTVSLVGLGLFYLQSVRRQFVAITLLPLLLLWIMELVGGFLVNWLRWVDEAGVSIPTTNRYFFLILLYFGFVASVYLLLSRRRQERADTTVRHASRRQLLYVIVGASCGVLLLLSTYLKLGFPLLTGVNRIDFAADSRLFEYVMRYRAALFLLLGVLFACTRSRFILLIALIYLVLAVLGADRVTYPVIMVSFFLLGYVLKREELKVSKRALSIVAICVGVIIYAFASSLSTAGWEIKLELLLRRVSLQAQTWALATTTDFRLIDFQVDRLEKEFANLVYSSSYQQWTDPLLGGWYFMMKYLPKNDLLWWRIENDNTLIMVFYPYLLEVYGLLPLIAINFTVPAAFVVVSIHLHAAVRRLDLVSIILLALILQGFVFLFVSGDFAQILGRWPILFWTIYVCKRYILSSARS